MAQRQFVAPPPFPVVYGLPAALALGLALFGGFAIGLYVLGGVAFGRPTGNAAALLQAHGQVQILGFAGLLILGVGSLLLPAFWRTRVPHPKIMPWCAGLVGVGLLAQLVGQPLAQGPMRQVLLGLALLLPPVGFLGAGGALLRLRLAQPLRPRSWEWLLLVGGVSLAAALVVRAAFLYGLLWSGAAARYDALHQVLLAVQIDGFLLAVTIAIQLRLLPSLARTRPLTGRVEYLGIATLVLAILVRVTGLFTGQPAVVVAGGWLVLAAGTVLFVATGLWRAGVPPTVQAPATRLPGLTRQVLRVIWAGLLLGLLGRAAGLLPADTVTHTLTSVYLVPLIVLVGLRMLPRMSAYPIRFPTFSGSLVWAVLIGGVLRAFGTMLGPEMGWLVAWIGGSLVTGILIVFAALAWSPWGVPTGQPRAPEVLQIEVPRKP